MGAKSYNFGLFSTYFGVFSPDLLIEYRIFILIVDISANLKNIDIDMAILKIIDIDKVILENIDIDIEKENFENVDIDIDIHREILEHIYIDIDMEILRNIDVDKILNRLEFGISNRATRCSNIIHINVRAKCLFAQNFEFSPFQRFSNQSCLNQWKQRGRDSGR